MNEATSDRVLAEERLRRARFQLMLRHPFLASAVAALPLVVVPPGTLDFETMATDGRRIYASTTFLLEADEDDLLFTVAHELMHCLLDHLPRRGVRKPLRWNYAVDYATNLLLAKAGFAVPDDALYEPRFDGLTAETIYDRLPTAPSPDGRIDLHLDPDSALAELFGAAAPGSDPSESGGDLPASGEVDGDGFGGAAAPDPWALSSDAWDRFRQALLKDALDRVPGSIAGTLRSEAEAAGVATIPWQAIVARFVGGLRRGDYRMTPFNRRHLWQGLFLPACEVPGPAHLVVAIDTSGSMSDDDIHRVLREVGGLRTHAQCVCTLIQADADVRHVREVEAFDELAAEGERFVVHGRGGTDFRPVFGWVERGLTHLPPPDALIYLTDGFGTAPQAPPPYPVLWVLVPAGKPPARWGEVLRLPPSPTSG